MVTARTLARRRAKRRAQRLATARSIGQLLVVLVGGVIGGGLAILAAFPDSTGPVSPPVLLAAAAVVGVATAVVARRLRAIDQPGRGRR